MKRFLFLIIIHVCATGVFGADDKCVVTTHTQMKNYGYYEAYYVSHACEWYHNSVDSTMIHLELFNADSYSSSVLVNQVWWGPPQNDEIKKVELTGLTAGIVDILNKYDTPSQKADIPPSAASTTLVIPDSLFVDCYPGEKMPDFFTGELVDRIGFPIVRVSDYAFNSAGSAGITYGSYVDPIHAKVKSGEFRRHTGIKKIVLTASVTEIGVGAFQGSLIEEINLENVVTIKSNAFKNCKNLKKVNLSSAMDIDIDAFCGVNIDTLIVRQESFHEVPAVFRYASIKHLDYDVPYLLSSPFITNYMYTSYFDSSPEVYVNTVKIGDNTTELRMYFCYGMPSLRTLYIGTKLREIPKHSFANTGLREIYAYSTEPYNVEDGAFSGVDKSNCILYVPKGCAHKYEVAPVLQDFIIKEMDSGIEDADIDKPAIVEVVYYDLYGRKLTEQKNGQVIIRLVKFSDGTVMSSKILNK